ncbi:DUF2252 domain-containing protein [Chitinophagaceae bacterium MMS25-I14]
MKPVAERILLFNKDRVPSLVSLKYDAMSADCFRFFRGSNHLFYEDLHKEPLFRKYPATWICGDLHLENFGSYKGDNKLVYFDVNDFDEAVLAPFTWDVARMTTSILLACREMKLDAAVSRKMANAFLAAYFNTLKSGKSRHVEAETSKGLLKTFLDKVALRKARYLLKERTVKNYTKLKIDGIKQLPVEEPEKQKLITALQKWISKTKDIRYHYHITDASCRIAGTGSLGQERYVLLAANEIRKPVLIDMKECMPASAGKWIKEKQPEWDDEAARIVWAQKMMQNTAPALLTTLQYEGKPFMLKMLQPTDDKINYLALANDHESMDLLLCSMGVLAASAHLRATGRKGSCIADDLIEAAHDEHLKKEILALATAYSKTTIAYYHDYVEAYNAGFFS